MQGQLDGIAGPSGLPTNRDLANNNPIINILNALRSPLFVGLNLQTKGDLDSGRLMPL
jgi:hypothetical protein